MAEKYVVRMLLILCSFRHLFTRVTVAFQYEGVNETVNVDRDEEEMEQVDIV